MSMAGSDDPVLKTIGNWYCQDGSTSSELCLPGVFYRLEQNMYYGLDLVGQHKCLSTVSTRNDNEHAPPGFAHQSYQNVKQRYPDNYYKVRHVVVIGWYEFQSTCQGCQSMDCW
jgi:hypothetical protein